MPHCPSQPNALGDIVRRIHIVPYKMGSKSAKLLKEALCATGIKAYRKVGTTLPPKQGTLVLYYGGGEVLPQGGVQLNRNRAVASNKLETFRALESQHVPIVPFTTDPAIAGEWDQIVCRATLTGHSGQGITIVARGGTLPHVPLFTQYIKKSMECRIHVFNGKVIDAQVKKQRRDLPEGFEVDSQVRNIHTGWVYCREDFTPDDRVKALAIAATAAVGLDFGAVDIIYNKYYNEYSVLEINTAPGLEGTTLTNYVKEICHVFANN